MYIDQKNDNILSITNINQSLSPKILRPGRSGGGEQSSSAFACAPVTVRSASMGMLKRGLEVRGRGEGGGGEESKEGGQKRRRVHQPSLISVDRVCALCVSTSPVGVTSCRVLFPLCGARWFGGQIIHDSGDAWDLLDLVHHLQDHLGKQRRQITFKTEGQTEMFLNLVDISDDGA